MMTFIRTSTCAAAPKRAALALVGLLAALPGWSQTIDRLPKPTATGRQSALNPAPLAQGDAQHRGRMKADILTGVLDGNRLATQLPYGRLAGPDGSIQPDFWPFPQPTQGATFTHDGNYYNVTSTFGQALFPWATPDDQGVSVAYPLLGSTAIVAPTTGVVAFSSAAWVLQNGPSTGAQGAGYHVVPARPNPTQFAAWYPRVDGLPGDYRNFGIRVFLPTPDTTGVETRIADATYTVVYHMPISPGRFMLKTKVVKLSQLSGGWFWLKDGNSSENYFPMMTEATYTGAVTRTGGAATLVRPNGTAVALGSAEGRARVELNNDTDSPQPSDIVVADQVTFRQDPMAIQSAPTIVGPHGGRKIDTGVLPPGVAIQQPLPGSNYSANPFPVTGGRIAHPNDSFNFANNPRDPAFSAATGDRGNPSVLYQGPTSLIDPRDAGGLVTSPGTAVNHTPYLDGLGNQIPFFSHAQVIVVRRERVHATESGVANANKNGALTKIVTSIHCVDSATRTEIWRFPDRTHLPVGYQFGGVAVLNAGLRNPTIGVDGNGDSVSQIPHVVAVDGGAAGTPDGAVQDDEVYLEGDSFASATIVPGVNVFGTALVPAYDAATFAMDGVAEAAAERYSKPGAVTREPIQMPVAYVALGNGTLLALDPFGNNDNHYFPNVADTTRLGRVRPGTTNALWVFSPASQARVATGTNAETIAKYHRRLKTEIPAVGNAFASAPTVAWALADDDPTLNSTTMEPRLFIGSQNGVLYALDARAMAAGVDGTGKPLAIPFRKGEQNVNPVTAYNAVNYNAGFDTEAAAHRLELKWWFRTFAGGAINASPAVSAWPHPRTSGGTSKGVYVTSGEGRVYCLDWQGPVRRSDHETNMAWDGSTGNALDAVPAANSAAAFNDDYVTHNGLVVGDTLAADAEEGTVRPRWAFPNTYQNTQALAIKRTADPDLSFVFPANRLLKTQNLLAGITSAPMLMDFPYIDPDDSRLSGIRRYVVISANDVTTGQGKLYLLDQIGDRRDFLSNPTPDVAVGATTPFAAPVPLASAHVYGQPLDLFASPLEGGSFSRATPTWTFRPVYDQYNGANAPIVADRNAPSTSVDPAQPARRPVPTIYVGGVGRLYAIDIDESTGLLVRWRDSGATQPQSLGAGVTVPGPFWTGVATDQGWRDLLNPADKTNPVNPMLRVGAKDLYAFNRILARTVPVVDGTDVESLVVTAGALQNRNNDTAKLAADALPTNPPMATVGPVVDATHPSVPLLPTDDPVILKPVLDNITSFGYNMGLLPPVLPTVDLTGRYGNQDIDDPLTTTRGAFPGTAAPAAAEPNVAYQYPVLWLTTAGGLEEDNALYQMSANIEGEDRTVGVEGTLGWALVDGDTELYNLDHILLASAKGVGGPYSGATTFTNAYYESFDSSFTARRTVLGAKLPADPSVTFAYYPNYEPNADASAFADAPRPHFKPRPLFEGNALAAPPLLTDDHTGQSGFPLDLNGLFYDKSYATVAGNTYNNEQGAFRLPAYTGIGSRFGLFTVERPVADAERITNFAVVGTPPSDDYENINPAGHRVTWIYAGGSEGILHEITPVFKRSLGGRINNFGGPPQIVSPTTEIPNAKVDVFDQADFNTMLLAAQAGNPIRPGRDGNLVDENGDATPGGAGDVTQNILSRAAKGQKNVFEWGQKAYVVVWDVPVTARSLATNPLPVPVPSSFLVQLNINGTGTQVPLATSGGVVSTYQYHPAYRVGAPALDPAYYHARLGMAFYIFDVMNREPGKAIHFSINGGQALIQGVPAEFGVVTPSSLANMATVIGRRNALEPDIFAANPLGVAAHLVATADGNLVAAATPVAGADAPPNSIGPFRTENGANGASNRTADQGASDGSRDPDRDGFDYSQALANGNTVRRFDLRRYTGLGVINPNFNQRIKDVNGANDPDYYVPVAAGTGYLGHGRTGSTDLGNTQRNLRIVNRSMLSSLGNVRAEVLHDLSWRWWPGNIPNADGGSDNPRKTPLGMGNDGRINPLPWESTPTADSALAPWKSGGQLSEAVAPSSADYPDIEATTANRSALSLIYGGQDLLRGPGELPNGQFAVTANPAGVISPIAPANVLAPYAATLSVTVPRFQPANLVAMHSLTSAYVAAAPEEFASAGSTGPLQLPRARTGDPYPRPLLNGGQPTIAPYGYTTQVRLFIDNNNDGKYTAGEAYRDVEVWSGVAVDVSLQSGKTDGAATLIDLGRVPGGFGMQNGLLGYGQGFAYQRSGFLPDPLTTTATYSRFFKPFNVENIGNVNLWNLRASQKVQNPQSLAADYGTNGSFYYFGMKGRNVDGKFGIEAVGADPLATLSQANLMPQIVTSLDPLFDSGWDLYLQTSLPAAIYNRDYAPFLGRHMLKKAIPGSANGSPLGLPDVARDPLVLGTESSAPRLGVTVPIGTPSGVYESFASNVANAPPMLSIFEDHDTTQDPDGTNIGYRAVPLLSGGVISPAGPTYGGINTLPPGFIPQSLAGGAVSQGTLRVRNTLRDGLGNIQRIVYQPHTSPAINLRLTVSEAPLTGLVPDWAQINPASNLTGLFSGLVPGFDPYPISENYNPLAPNLRAASSLQPTAYRGADGTLHTYFVRSLAPSAQPNARGSQLYHSHLAWNTVLGTWQTNQAGVPVNDPTASTAQWFTAPALLTTGAGQESNLSPFVLHVAPSAAQATLFWMNSTPTGGGNSVDTLAYSPLQADGTPVGALPFVANPDPSLRRFGVRAFFEPATQTTTALYYGGPAGKWSLYYVPRGANASGVPAGAVPNAASERNVERTVPLPSGFVSTYEPSAVVRRLASVNNGNTPVIDLYYTGVLRTTNTPDLYMTRYTLDGAGRNARLNPVTLPTIVGEPLERIGRDQAWRSKHIAWVRTLGSADVPIIQVNGTPITVAANWRWDNASQMLYQNVTRPGLEGVQQVLVDTAVGVVRFRGAGVPGGNDVISATYQPQTYQLTRDVASDSGALALFDNQPLAGSLSDASHRGGILRRPLGPLASGRTWTLWQKGVAAQNAASLFYSIRRVGVDLHELPGAAALVASQQANLRESVALGNPDGFANQLPAISVTVGGFGAVPFDVDIARGKVFVEPQYEGLPIRVQYTAYSANGGTRACDGTTNLALVEETTSAGSNLVGVSALDLKQAQNEGQVFAFVDLFNQNLIGPVTRPNGPNGAFDPATQTFNDPTLNMGKLWMFWSSPRARTGLFPSGPNLLQALPRGYDLYYQTLAPNLESFVQ